MSPKCRLDHNEKTVHRLHHSSLGRSREIFFISRYPLKDTVIPVDFFKGSFISIIINLYGQYIDSRVLMPGGSFKSRARKRRRRRKNTSSSHTLAKREERSSGSSDKLTEPSAAVLETKDREAAERSLIAMAIFCTPKTETRPLKMRPFKILRYTVRGIITTGAE